MSSPPPEEENEETPAADDEAGEEVHQWSAFHDAEGRIYYCNTESGESSWDAPEKFNPPPPPEETASEETAQEETQHGEPTETAASEPEPNGAKITESEADTAEGPTASSLVGWVAYQDDEGREYYFNAESNETTWDKPDSYEPAPAVEPTEEDEDEADQVSPVRAQSPVEMDEYPESPVPGEEKREEEREPEESVEEIDPAVKRLEEAEEALNQSDAIMEPGVMSHVTEVVTSEEGNPQKAISSLIESYYGQTAICGLLGRWLADLKSQSASTDEAEQGKLFNIAADDIRQMAQEVVNKVANEKFTKTGGDSILNLSRSEAAFLEDMMDSSRWRKLLIDLSASNKDSALLMYCLQAISKRGHHREIARRINQSDHFAVFNAMLASELTVVGKIAVSSCRDADTSIGMEELVGDLRRTCTSTAYTYIYAIEVLRHLVTTAKVSSASGRNGTSSRFYRAIRKWERLNEDLQSTMVDPAATTGSSPLFRKRRLDVAIVISELHQRQRRRLVPSENGDTPMVVDTDDRTKKVESAVLNFLRRYSLGTQVDDRILDSMLPSSLGGDSTNLVGKLLIKRPLTVKALLGYLFRPGSQRVGSQATKNKCARLIALAVLAAEKEALDEAREFGKENMTSDSDEVALTRVLSQGSQLCERLENMVSFIVATEAKKEGTQATPGEQICSLAVKCAPVAQGVIMWAGDVSKGSEFVTGASYPTVSLSILSLVRIISVQLPFTRRDALEVALGFLRHSNSEISYKTMSEIKEQALRLLLFLCARGEAPTVLGRITELLKHAGSSYMDASLVRYFVSGLLEVAKGPFSVPFVRSIGALLKAPGCAEAIRSEYFGDKNKERLGSMMGHLNKMLTEGLGDNKTLTPEDGSLVKSVLSIYVN